MEDNIIDSAFKEIGGIVKTAISRPIKVCIVCSPGMGGSGIMGSSVASELSSRGHDVHLVSYKKPFRLKNRGVKTHVIPLRNYQVLEHFPIVMSTASKLYDVVKKNDMEIINVHYAIPYSAASYLAREMFKSENVKIPIVTTVHGTDVHTIGQKKELKDIVRFTLKSSDGITTVCEYLANQIKKNVDSIIEVFRNLVKTTPCRLVLVGDGPEKYRIRKKVARFGLSKDVIFAGSRKDMEKFYSAADVFLMSSLREGLPLSILEAMSSSLPVVSTKV